jgi:hypothetical protein
MIARDLFLATAKTGLLAMLWAFGLTAGPAAAQAAPQDAQPQASAPTATTPRPPAPVVAYKDGQLTIVAENVTLSEIMSALHAAMGTQVDLPAGSSTERIWAHLGPGSAHRVLSELLGNTDLNYIIQGSPTDSGVIQSVTLSVRTPDGGPGKTGSPVESALARRGAHVAPTPAPEPEPTPEPAPVPQETAAASPPAPAATQPADSAPPPATTSPDSVSPHEPVSASMAPTGTPNINPETPQPPAGSFNPHPSPPPSMSTDQMVQQLANMYQQRRQMQQGQGGSTPN